MITAHAPVHNKPAPTTQAAPPAGKPADPPMEPLLSAAEVAIALGFTSSGLLSMLNRTGAIPIVRVGRRAMFRRSDVETLIARSIKPWTRNK